MRVPAAFPRMAVLPWKAALVVFAGAWFGASAPATVAATFSLHTVATSSASRVRIVNLADIGGTVAIRGFDGAGDTHGPADLFLDARESVTLTAREIERGAPAKGFPKGLGDGSGFWQLEFSTTLPLGGLSYLAGSGRAEVLATLEPAASLTHFMRTHRIADMIDAVRVTASENFPHQVAEEGIHEMLFAYAWRPERTFRGVELGWSQTEHWVTGRRWQRFGGLLRYSAFAVQTPPPADQARGVEAYGIGRGCSELPPTGVRLVGVAVAADTTGTVAYGPFSISTLPPSGNQLNHRVRVWVGTLRSVTTDDQIPGFRTVWSFGRSGSFRYHGPRCVEVTGWLDVPGRPGMRLAFGARRSHDG